MTLVWTWYHLRKQACIRVSGGCVHHLDSILGVSKYTVKLHHVQYFHKSHKLMWQKCNYVLCPLFFWFFGFFGFFFWFFFFKLKSSLPPNPLPLPPSLKIILFNCGDWINVLFIWNLYGSQLHKTQGIIFSHKFVAYIIAYSSGLFFSSNKQILSKFLI